MEYTFNADAFKQAIAQSPVTKAQLAEKMGISHSALSHRIRRTNGNFALMNVNAYTEMCNAIDRNPADFFQKIQVKSKKSLAF